MSLSPDGKWFWDGKDWIPAPPSSEDENTNPINNGGEFISTGKHNEEKENVFNFDLKNIPLILGTLLLVFCSTIVICHSIQYTQIGNDNQYLVNECHSNQDPGVVEYQGQLLNAEMCDDPEGEWGPTTEKTYFWLKCEGGSTSYEYEGNNISGTWYKYCTPSDNPSIMGYNTVSILFIIGISFIGYSQRKVMIYRINTRRKAKAEVEFISGNIVKAMGLYKKIGDVEKIQECAKLIDDNGQSNSIKEKPVEISSTTIKTEPPMIQDSVVSGDINYIISSNQNDIDSSKGNRSSLQTVLTTISIVVTTLSLMSFILRLIIG